MNHQHEEAKLSPEEIAEIYRNMEARGLSHVFCQACSEEMKPEQSRKSSTGLIMWRTFLGIWPASISPEILTLYPICPHRYDTLDHA